MIDEGETITNEAHGTHGITFDKPLTIKGIMHGKDARGRSVVGLGKNDYTGGEDPAESTVYNKAFY